MIESFSDLIFKMILPLFGFVLKHGNYSDEDIEKKCGYIKQFDFDGSKVIMFHGVSVGEINAIEKLVKTTRTNFPDIKIVVTTGTNTGQEIANKKLGDAADLITYFPFDTPECTNRFLDNVKPNMVFMAETEIWPFFGIKCKQKGIKLYIINGRISDRTYQSYLKLKFLFSRLLRNYTGIFTQSSEDLDKFISLGANIETTKRMNNLKFDISAPDVDINLEHSGRIILAASTHTGEDEIVLKVFENLKNKYSDLKLIIAPRHLTRKDDVEKLIRESGYKYGLRSENANLIDNEILLLDTMGELGKIFAFSYISFIGGSFNKTGGHNPLESIIFSKPVISGPSIHNFKDIYSIIKNANAGFIVNNKNEFEDIADKLLNNEQFYNTTSNNCSEVFASQQGALEFVQNVIKSNI